MWKPFGSRLGPEYRHISISTAQCRSTIKRAGMPEVALKLLDYYLIGANNYALYGATPLYCVYFGVFWDTPN